MARRRSRRKHFVDAELQIAELTKSGSSINLRIYADDEKIGELEIGRGSLIWYGRKWKSGRRISWSRFAEKMDQ